MINSENKKALGIIILIGLALMILVAILQVLTVIFMVLTVVAVITTIIFVIISFRDQWESENYLYAGIAFFCIFLFFFIGRATYSASEVLINNELTSGIMKFTTFFFQLQTEKEKTINVLKNVETNVISNLTNLIQNTSNP